MYLPEDKIGIECPIHPKEELDIIIVDSEIGYFCGKCNHFYSSDELFEKIKHYLKTIQP